jgi:hypothetical protein
MISLPKPLLRPQLQLKRLLPPKSMTIAIGTHFADGVILCADTKFVDDNGSVTYGSKIQFRDDPSHPENVFAIAHAANDTNAASMLSTDILDAVVVCEDHANLETSIKQRMTNWQSDYGQSSVPLLQFIFACSLAQKAYLYFCQPPNIAIQKLPGASTSAGSAVKIVETLLPFVLQRQPLEPLLGDVESTLLKLAYLMRRAKSEDLYAGGDTEAIVIKSNGQCVRISEEEMKDAEDFSASLDSLFRYCCYGFFSMRSLEEQKTFLKRFSELFRMHLKDTEEQWFFHSLEDL